MISEHKARLEQATNWANGEWVALREDTPPRLYGQYEILSDNRCTVQWFEPTMLGYRGESVPVGSFKSWKEFIDGALRRGFRYRWSEPIPYVAEAVKPQNVRIPDGIPGIRDVDAVCTMYDPGEAAGDCETDGHHLCSTCRKRVLEAK